MSDALLRIGEYLVYAREDKDLRRQRGSSKKTIIAQTDCLLAHPWQRSEETLLFPPKADLRDPDSKEERSQHVSDDDGIHRTAQPSLQEREQSTAIWTPGKIQR
eukprot:766720-Hanusia_phi.AAC.6